MSIHDQSTDARTAELKAEALVMARNLVKSIIETVELKLSMAAKRDYDKTWSDIIGDIAKTFERFLGVDQ